MVGNWGSGSGFAVEGVGLGACPAADTVGAEIQELGLREAASNADHIHGLLVLGSGDVKNPIRNSQELADASMSIAFPAEVPAVNPAQNPLLSEALSPIRSHQPATLQPTVVVV